MNDRIKLAEAMGWVWEKHGSPDEYPVWCRPDGSISSPQRCSHEKCEPGAFNPFTDANDCEALIRYLNEQKWAVEIKFPTTMRADVSLVSIDDWHDHYQIECDDWKQGVCELALKVLK